jgi:hypothetical protein
MKKYKFDIMKRGWFIGDFSPSVLKTKKFEVGYLSHKKNEKWETHYHKKSIEYNLLVKGKMKINGKTINKGEIFVFKKGEICSPVFLKNCEIVVVKVPSLPTDKFVVKKK